MMISEKWLGRRRQNGRSPSVLFYRAEGARLLARQHYHYQANSL